MAEADTERASVREGELTMAEDEEWFDISVRRPNEVVDRNRGLPPPTRTWTSTHHRGDNCGEGGDAIKLVLEGFGEDAPSTMISSGLTLWEASDLLCDHLVADEKLRSMKTCRLLELGSGLGKCGLLAHRLAHPVGSYSIASTVLTDGDTNALQLLRKNVARNTDDQVISCQQLIWGEGAAKAFLSRQRHDSKFNIILGSDIIYAKKSEGVLFDTVEALLSNDGKFILAHDEANEVRVDTIVWAAYRVGLFHEVLKQDGQMYLLCFQHITAWNVRSLVTRLQDKNSAQEEEIRALRAGKGHLEDKCRCLEERCVSLRDDRDSLPECIMLAFGIDHIASIASFLGSQDFANLSSTCKQFGLKLHKIGTRPVSLWHKIAHGLYKSASDMEKESLPAYKREKSPFFFYNELLELRKPLTFEQLFGRSIDHAIGNKSKMVKSNRTGAVKMPGWGGRYFTACTGVCGHVMRAGEHYAKFESQGLIGGQYPLWFGIVRPLQRMNLGSKKIFTPLCARFFRDFDELRNEEWGEVQCCVYSATSGKCLWSDWDPAWADESPESGDESNSDGIYSMNWQGMQSFDGGTLGLLLDYDARTLTVYKNGDRLGVMKDGLSGPYSFFVSVPLSFRSSDGINIERGWACDLDNQTSLLPCKRELSETLT